VLQRATKKRPLVRQSYVLLLVPLLVSAFTHLWNPVGFPDLFYDEGVYMRRSIQVQQGLGPEESGTYFDHPYLGQLFLSSVFNIIGYPDSVNPKPGDEQSVEMLYLVPRVIMGILAVLDTFLVYKIADKRYNRKVAFIASILFAVMPMTWILRRILLDSILLPLLLTSIFFALHRNVRKYPTDTISGSKGVKVNGDILAIISGIFLGLAIFTKIPVFMLIPLVACLVYRNSSSKDKKVRLRTLGLWFIPVVLIPALWPIIAAVDDQFNDWRVGVFDQASRNNDGLARVLGLFYKYDPILLLMGVIGFVYSAFRKDTLILLWVIPFLLFLYFLNYGTYFYIIPILPAFCIASARFIIEVPEKIEKKIAISSIWSCIVSLKINWSRIVNVARRITNNSIKSEKNQPTISGYIEKGIGNEKEFEGSQSKDLEKNDRPILRVDKSQRIRSVSRFGMAYSSMFFFLVIGGIGITSTVSLISLDASWAQIKAAAFSGGYVEERNADSLMLVSSPVYSWIHRYVFGFQALASFNNVPQDEVEYSHILLLADNHMRAAMKKAAEENLWSLYNNTIPVSNFTGRLTEYDTRDYPYTNLLNMKEGALIEIKEGSDIRLEPKKIELQENFGTSPNQLPFSSVEDEEGSLMMHMHQHLGVSQDGRPVIVPANIGIDPNLHKDHSLDIYGSQKSPLHTHTDTGTIHVESKIITNYTLGEFLDVWGLDLSNKAVKAVIDGKDVSDYGGHVLKDGEDINLLICSRGYMVVSNTC
jgi:Dolichyl-phosphate-mannose-protein mannosyltransferase